MEGRTFGDAGSTRRRAVPPDPVSDVGDPGASSAASRAAGTPTWSTTTIRSTPPQPRKTATICRKTWRTRQSNSSVTPGSSTRTNRSSCTWPHRPGTPRTMSSPNGPTGTSAGSDQGYEAIRAEILQRQKDLGLLPEDTELSPINPHGEPATTGPDGQSWLLPDTVRPWPVCDRDRIPVSWVSR